MPGTARSVLILGVLCLLCGVTGAVAIAATGHPTRHHSSRSARACHRTKHHRCPATHAAKRHTKRHRTSKRARPKGGTRSSGPTSSWTNVPAAVGPGSTPGSSTPPSPGGATGPTEPPSTPAPARVQVTAEDSEAFRFVLSRPTVPAGRVIIEFVNHGQDEHNLNAIEPAEGSVAGSIPDTLPNAHPSVTLNLRRGSYTLFCSLSDHEAKGMKATLLVN